MIPTSSSLSNALEWIRFTAGMHYLGAAFDPEHMRDIANMAADALEGKLELPEFWASMEASRANAREMAEKYSECWPGDADG